MTQDTSCRGQNVYPEHEPETIPCEWCEEPSVEAVPHVRAGLYIYVCAAHVEIAKKAKDTKRTRQGPTTSRKVKTTR